MDKLFYEMPEKLDVKNNIKCGACGATNIGHVNVKGRCFPFKDLERVEILVDFYMCGCLSCDNLMLKSGDGKHLDQAIRNSIILLRNMHKITININNFLEKKEELSSLHEGRLLQTSIHQDLILLLLSHENKISELVKLSEEKQDSYEGIKDNLSKISIEAQKIIEHYN